MHIYIYYFGSTHPPLLPSLPPPIDPPFLPNEKPFYFWWFREFNWVAYKSVGKELLTEALVTCTTEENAIPSPWPPLTTSRSSVKSQSLKAVLNSGGLTLSYLCECYQCSHEKKTWHLKLPSLLQLCFRGENWTSPSEGSPCLVLLYLFSLFLL